MELLNQPVDISGDFFMPENEMYVAGPVTAFNAAEASGTVRWLYYRWVHDWSFMKIGRRLARQEKKEVFWHNDEAYADYRFSLSFINNNSIRLRMHSTGTVQDNQASLMLDGEPGPGNPWPVQETATEVLYTGSAGSVRIQKENWKLDIYNEKGQWLTGTQGMEILDALHHKSIPWLFTRRVTDYSRSMAASFYLSPGEKIVGGGESFTALNKRGQKLVLYTADAQSTATAQQYKPVPFIMSNRGYGMFFHTTTPVTMDIGHGYDGSNSVFTGDDGLDVFIFLGSPKEILEAYTSLTGRSPLPPLWSFGLWMGRFSYWSAEEVKSVAGKLREHKIPCDVIHIDAGWFENGIQCDFAFGRQTFPEPKEMIAYLRKNGFRVSLWQLPYFTPQNPLYEEIIAKKLYVQNGDGKVPAEDAVLDFSNAVTKAWYTQKVKTLLDLGVSVLKADFGEAAPLRGHYASGRSGFYEHNSYPIRYTQLLHDITGKATGEAIIWARSAWAGGQRYPVHWGGDAEVSDTGMAGSMRGGLSLGLSGFSFWSHDIGGFFSPPREELFARWAVFGLLSSHSRVHGFPPREPWHFSDDFLKLFRQIVEMRYRLMPYIYTQAAISARQGWPMLRALLLEYPADPVAWYIDDQYLLGDSMMVAPLMEANTNRRKVYLPEGKWINYFTKEIYEGSCLQDIAAAIIPGIVLVRYGSIIPHLPLAQSTDSMNWADTELVMFSTGDVKTAGHLYIPGSDAVLDLSAVYSNDAWQLSGQHKLPYHIKTF